MSIVYQADAPKRSSLRGLSGAPVRKVGVSSAGDAVYADSSGDIVFSDGSLFTGVFKADATGYIYQANAGKAQFISSGNTGIAGALGSSNTGSSSKKCCNCTTSDVNENWFLTATKRTAQDVPVSITRRKTVCQDPNSQVKINCNQLKSAAGLQGIGSLGCGCDARM